jgi:hypothetical protein
MADFHSLKVPERVKVINRVQNRLYKRVRNILKSNDTNKYTANQLLYMRQSVDFKNLDQLNAGQLSHIYAEIKSLDEGSTSTVKGAKQSSNKMSEMLGSDKYDRMNDNQKSDFWRAFNTFKEEMRYNSNLDSEQLIPLFSDAAQLTGIHWDLVDTGIPIKDINGNIKTYPDGTPMTEHRIVFSNEITDDMSAKEIEDHKLRLALKFSEQPEQVRRSVRKGTKYDWSLAD